jgi:hypothetical protein
MVEDSMYKYLEKLGIDIVALSNENLSFSNIQEICHIELACRLLKLMAGSAESQGMNKSVTDGS